MAALNLICCSVPPCIRLVSLLCSSRVVGSNPTVSNLVHFLPCVSHNPDRLIQNSLIQGNYYDEDDDEIYEEEKKEEKEKAEPETETKENSTSGQWITQIS